MLGNSSANISSSNGALTITSSNFALDANGNVTASNVRLSGNITANTGSIGGWVIGAGVISSSKVHISSSDGGAIKLGATVPTSVISGNRGYTGNENFITLNTKSNEKRSGGSDYQ
jgi:hypothetical protein